MCCIAKEELDTKGQYLNSTNLYKEATRRYEEISVVRSNLEKKLTKYPPGKIHIVNARGRAQFYLRTSPKDRSGEYIQKHKTEIIQKYLQKKYDEQIYAVLLEESNSLEKMLKKNKDIRKKIQSAYSDNLEEVKTYINPIDVSDEDYIAAWQSQKYERKPIDENQTVWQTNRGEFVRSKSELTIANLLDKNGIPYKYECPFVLSNGKTIYPDFTLLNMNNRKEIYWEHRGMMDDMEYARHAVIRLKNLAKEGVTIGDNLIITEECTGWPLGTDEIERIIMKVKDSV